VDYETLKVRFQDQVCFAQIDRPGKNNTISDQLVGELDHLLSRCEESITVLVLSGSPEVFCFGADFAAEEGGQPSLHAGYRGPGPLYDLWLRFATGPFVTISHVRGRANAGGLGFVAASDIVLAEETAQFSLSELLFGLHPACVMPFLIRRIGFQRAHYLTLLTQPIPAATALEWGLADACEKDSDALVRRHLLRLRRLTKTAIARYKRYAAQLSLPLAALKPNAVAANVEVFSDPRNLEGIARYVERGIFPWEAS
jgi:polyketide biosynthesis enoyl-CoA hydratase PksH